MNLEFLAFGNVSAAGVLLIALLVAVTGLVELVLYVGRFCLSLDKDGAPSMLTINWLYDKLVSVSSCLEEPHVVCEGDKIGEYTIKCKDKYYDISDNEYWTCSRYSGCLFTLQKATEVCEKLNNERDEVFNIEGATRLAVSLLLADVAIFWLNLHITSAIWFLSTAGIVMTLRCITGHLWSHGTRIVKLEEEK